MAPRADSPKPHPRHAWLPAFLPADARRFRLDDEDLARALEAYGADVVDAADVDVEIVRSASALRGDAACAFVRVDRGETDAVGLRALRVGRRISGAVRTRAAVRAAGSALSARGYRTIHVASWERPRAPHLRLPGGRAAPRSAAALLARHAVVAGYADPRPATHVESALSAGAARARAGWSAIVAGSGILVIVGDDAILRTGVGPAKELVEAERAALAELWRATPPSFVSERVPRPLAAENDHFAAWSLETRVAGDATAPPYGDEFLDDCVAFLAALPRAADAERPRSLETDAAVIAQWLPAAQGNALTSLAHQVEATLADVPRSFGHGDFAAGNLLGRDGRLAGVVDWAKGGPGRWALLDLLHLRANIEAARTRTHLGEVIVQFLLPWAQRGGDRLLSDYRDRAGLTLTAPQLDAAVTAYWLDFIASELAAYADRGRRRAWVEKNVALVAERLLARSRSARSGTRGAIEHDAAPQRVRSAEDRSAVDRPDVPRVAVVVPCFNDGATLPATVDSVRAQEPCELVVVDDGSDDEQTLELLGELAAGGTQVVRQENRGPAAARMTGVRSTSARYVLPLDADDLVAAGALTALADALDRDPDAVVAWGNTQMFGDAAVHVPKARSLDAWQITYVNPMPTATMIRRDALLDVGGWQLETGYEDWDLWMAFAERGCRGVHLNMTVAFHRVHTSRQFSRDFGRHAQIEDELRRRHEPLFRHRRRNWLRSTAPWRVRLLLPIVYAFPLVPRTVRFRLAVLVGNPLVVPRLWLQARRARAARAAAE